MESMEPDGRLLTLVSPLNMVEHFSKTGDKSLLWEAHFAGIERKYCHIEKLANLDLLPPHGFKAACFPVKTTGASAA
jgi:kynurenine formamidase